jgi:hypothetical protein
MNLNTRLQRLEERTMPPKQVFLLCVGATEREQRAECERQVAEARGRYGPETTANHLRCPGRRRG